MNLFELRTEIPQTQIDQADEVLLELGVDGWSVQENVLTKRAWVVGIFAGEEQCLERWAELRPLLVEAGVACEGSPVVSTIEDEDWRNSYKAHFKAWSRGRLHWVPEWERGSHYLPPGHVVLWLDPGLAFGTGNHETTRLCCERLVEWSEGCAQEARAQARIIDAGCGSGILALSANLLGFEQVEGFDNDPEAVRISGENAALNGMAGRVRFYVGDLLSGLQDRKADFLMANIQADVLMRFSSQLLAAVAPGGRLVLSGILAQERDAVRNHFAAHAKAWALDSRLMGEWADLSLVRPS
jgi:ribosomal protein L11 methyltransferase